MVNSRRDAGREGFWRKALKRQAGSGLSVRAFCGREGLGESNFYAWRREIGLRDREATATAGRKGKAKSAKPRPAFVPVAVEGGPQSDPGIVLELGGGRRLRFCESIGADRLAAIVRALEAAS